ncbi:MAG: preprotein translocase subunit SecG [Bacteroidales bacterium]|jgi:preprotein translocase subunit SecG|nr:preprotein translocase subunit SecG [Bacteroidales bacterium]
MYTVLIALIVIAAVLLVLIVLVQNSKGGGLAPNLNAGTQFGGVAEQKSKLEKYTWGLVIIVAVLSIVASVSNGTKNQGNQESGVRDIMINQNVVPQAPASTTTAPSLQPGE